MSLGQVHDRVDQANRDTLTGRPYWQALHSRMVLVCLAALLPLAPLASEIIVVEQLYLVIVPVVVLGVVHGGADPWVGRSLFGSLGFRYPSLAFYSAYLCGIILILTAWVLIPLATLAGFLSLSIVHFGTQDSIAFGVRRRPLEIAVLGSIPVLGPLVGHPETVAVIFNWLIVYDGNGLAGTIRWLVQPLVALWLIGAGMALSRVWIEQDAAAARWLAIGMAVLALTMLMFPPLIAFALYFCLLHSFGHVLEMARSRSGPWSDWTLLQWSRRLWPATAGAVALGVAGWLVLQSTGSGSTAPGADLARVLFWGLAALTAPHVVLHESWRARRRLRVGS